MFGVIQRLRQRVPLVLVLLAMAASGQNAAAEVREEKSDLGLPEALRLALGANPELAGAAKELDALEGATQQAGLLRNPELSIEGEDIGADRARGLQRFTTYRLGQAIELGGKRGARVAAATLTQDIARQEYAAKRLALQARVANAFVDVLAAQERLRLADENVQLAQSAAQAIGKRVLAGKAPPIEETKSQLALSTVRIEQEQARRELVAARKLLSLLWGNAEPQFARALGAIATPVAVPEFEVLAQRLRNHPLAARSLKHVEQRRALVDLQQSQGVPDITVSAGYRRYAQTGESTALLGIAIPIPLFDRNQGNLREARQRLNQALDEQAASTLRQQADLAQTYENLLAAQHEIGVLRDEVLPGAISAFDVAKRGYELGKFAYLDLLDAQRTLFQTQALYVRAQVNYQKLCNELERLTAAPLVLQAIQKAENQK